MDVCRKQNGFVLMLFIVVVFIVAALWIATQHQRIISLFKTDSYVSDEYELRLVKQRLLNFATLTTELYSTNASGNFKDSGDMPAPGYLPCPDLDGDGSLSTSGEESCGNYEFDPTDVNKVLVPRPNRSALGACNGVDYCVGYVPERLNNRNFYFAPAGKYYYFFDMRYAYLNTSLDTSKWDDIYTPLSPVTPNGGSALNLDPDVGDFKGLVLDGKSGYIAVIIDAGDDGLNAENSDQDVVFESENTSIFNSDNSDKVIGITFDEWLLYVGNKICTQYDNFSHVSESRLHWFNGYSITNKKGSGWRQWGQLCP